jgi:Kdo2-lipid IVA lauroyltransferase/acyltransferase
MEVAAVNALIGIARATPRRVGLATFAATGAIAARCFPRDCRRTVDNLGLAFPEAPAPIRQALALATFKALGRNIYEFLRLDGASKERVVSLVERVEGLEHLTEAFRRGKGVVVVTGHIGCWELVPAYFAATGHTVTVVGRRMRVEGLNRRLVEIRRRLGVQTLDRDDNPRPMIDILRRGDSIGVLIDQHTSVAGVWVPFFGRPAYTPTAVAKLALSTGAAIVPMAIFMNARGRHVIHVQPAIDMAGLGGAEREATVRAITAACSLALERLIRIDPKQWVWFHERWREPKPDGRAEVAYAAQR